MRAREIEDELNHVKKAVQEQSKRLEACINKRNELYSINEILPKNAKGNRKLNLLGHTYEELESKMHIIDGLANRQEELEQSEILYYDSFESMREEIESIKGDVENAGTPQNHGDGGGSLDDRQSDIVCCLEELCDKYNEIIVILLNKRKRKLKLHHQGR